MGKLMFELVDEVVVFAFMGQELIDFCQNFIRTKFLFGPG
jgi:hypothetical protein